MSAEREALARDVAQTIARLARLEVEAMPAAFRDFADRLEREIGGPPPADMGPGIGGVPMRNNADPRR